MIRTGICNPHILSLLSRVRHTNTLVIADSMFPHWPGLVEVDISLVMGQPTVPQVVAAVIAQWKAGTAWMAEEFLQHQSAEVVQEFRDAFGATPLHLEPHVELKRRVPLAIGLIRTGESRIYTNVVLESA